MRKWIRTVAPGWWKQENYCRFLEEGHVLWHFWCLLEVSGYWEARVASVFTYASIKCYRRSWQCCPASLFIHPLISQILIKHLLHASHKSMKFCWLHLYFQSEDSEVTYFKIISSRIPMASRGGSIFLFYIYHCIFHKLKAELTEFYSFISLNQETFYMKRTNIQCFIFQVIFFYS